MAWTLDVDRDHHLAYIRITGVLTFHDIDEIQDALRAHPDFDPALPVLLDARSARVELTQQHMLALAERTPLARGSRIAMIADDPEFARARDFEFIRELSVESDVMRACRTIEEALSWLGIEGWRPTREDAPLQARRR